MHCCNATRESPIVPCRLRRAVTCGVSPSPRAEGSVRGFRLAWRYCVSCRSRRVRRLGPRPRPLGLLLPPLVDGVCIYLLVHRSGSVEGDSRSAGSGNRSRPIGTRDDSPIPAGSGFRDATGVFKFANLNRPPSATLVRMRAQNPMGRAGVHPTAKGRGTAPCHWAAATRSAAVPPLTLATATASGKL